MYCELSNRNKVSFPKKYSYIRYTLYIKTRKEVTG